MTRKEALEKDEQELAKADPPPELLKFLNDNNMTYKDYHDNVVKADKTLFEPKMQKIARNIYYRFRRL